MFKKVMRVSFNLHNDASTFNLNERTVQTLQEKTKFQVMSSEQNTANVSLSKKMGRVSLLRCTSLILDSLKRSKKQRLLRNTSFVKKKVPDINVIYLPSD